MQMGYSKRVDKNENLGLIHCMENCMMSEDVFDYDSIGLGRRTRCENMCIAMNSWCHCNGIKIIIGGLLIWISITLLVAGIMSIFNMPALGLVLGAICGLILACVISRCAYLIYDKCCIQPITRDNIL